MNNWLLIKENEVALEQICVQILTTRAPEELPLFEEIFPQYIEIAVKDTVEIGTTTDDPFSFSGESELVLMVLLPMAGLLLSALLIHFGLNRVDELRRLSNEDLEHAVSEFDDARYRDKSLIQAIINTLIG